MYLRPQRTSKFDMVLDHAIDALLDMDANSEEWSENLKEVERLVKLKNESSRKQIDPNVALTVSANLLGIAMIVRHENLNVITSKALSFVKKV